MNDVPSQSPEDSGHIAMARPISHLPWPAPQARAPSPLELPTLPHRTAALDFALVFFTLVVVAYGFEFVVAVTSDALDGITLDVWLVVQRKWLDASVAALFVAYFLIRNKLPRTAFGLRTDAPLNQLCWTGGGLVAVFGVLVASTIAITMLIMAFPGLEGDLEGRVDVVNSLPTSNPGLSVLLLIPVAIHEELIFRGMLLPYLRRLTGRWWLAVAISSAVFALLHIHQGWFGVIQIFGVGTVLAVFFVLSRSLIAVTVVHFLYNFVQFQMVNLASDIFEQYAPPG